MSLFRSSINARFSRKPGFYPSEFSLLEILLSWQFLQHYRLVITLAVTTSSAPLKRSLYEARYDGNEQFFDRTNSFFVLVFAELSAIRASPRLRSCSVKLAKLAKEMNNAVIAYLDSNLLHYLIGF